MPKTIALLATLDTKGPEVEYIKRRIEGRGKGVLLIDTGLRGVPAVVTADITRETLAEAAGSSMNEIEKEARGPAIRIMGKGIAKTLVELYAAGKFDGVMAIGGQDGALLASAGMMALPVGVPKLIVTPIAQGTEKFGDYVGTRDIIMMHSVIDILGINEVSKKIFDNAAGAIVGMVDMEVRPGINKPKMIGVTMYGNTTPAVMRAKGILEKKGYEVVVFHPNGTGGRAMEEMVDQGVFTAVLDMTPHEITDDLFGGLHGAPNRLEAAGRTGIPQLIVPGGVDFLILGPVPSLSPKDKARKVYDFNPAVCLARTTIEEMIKTAQVMAERLNRAKGPTEVVIPLGGFDMYCHPGEPLHYPEADRAFIAALKENLKPEIKVVEVDAHINDPPLAETAAAELLRMIEG